MKVLTKNARLSSSKSNNWSDFQRKEWRSRRENRRKSDAIGVTKVDITHLGANLRGDQTLNTVSAALRQAVLTCTTLSPATVSRKQCHWETTNLAFGNNKIKLPSMIGLWGHRRHLSYKISTRWPSWHQSKTTTLISPSQTAWGK